MTGRKILITYENSIPESVIEKFKLLNLSKSLNADISIEKKIPSNYSNITGSESYHIVIEIGLIMSNAIIGNASFELLKNGISVLYSGLFKEKEEVQKKSKVIILKLSTSDKNIDVEFSDNINEELVNSIVDKAFNYLSSDNIKNDFLIKENLINRKTEKPRIRIAYNKETKRFEPKIYKSSNEIMKDLIRRATTDF